MSKIVDSATQINDLNNSLKDIKTAMDDPSPNSKGIDRQIAQLSLTSIFIN